MNQNPFEEENPFADSKAAPVPSINTETARKVPPPVKARSLNLPQSPRAATFSDLDEKSLQALQNILGPEIPALELFQRISVTRSNAEAWAKGVRTFSADSDMSNSITVGIPKQPSFLDRLQMGFKKVLGVSDQEEVSSNQHYSIDAIPDIPENYTQDDYLGIAIHYHEKGSLELSAHYLDLAAKNGSALGCYLLALSRRHGWGLREDKQKAFFELLTSAERLLLTIPTIFRNSPTVKVPRSRKLSKSATTIKDFGIFSGGKETELFNEILEVLPLPLFEIAVSFHQGWGVIQSFPAALYYYSVAAKLGDPDAMYELGYCYLNGIGVRRDKELAAKWLRDADSHGKRVIGESWIFKEKWGGNQ